jgi:8-oxo-dGTP pyrophosphatase MutT (NUDIX family)
MAQRFDYYDDPEAPPANSIRPSAGAYAVKDGAVLLIRRSDNDNWSMPGGAQDPGESLTRTAIRETLEETGIKIRATGLVGIFTDPRHVVHYTSNDEVRQEFTVIYRAEYLDGDPAMSDESTDVQWVPLDQLDDLPMDNSQRKRLEWARNHAEPWIDDDGD